MNVHARHGAGDTSDRAQERQDIDRTANAAPGDSDRPDPQPSPRVPRGGMNPEVGDMDAEADPNRQEEHDDEGLPGRLGGGLMGG